MTAKIGGELRAFVAARIGGYGWIVDLLPDYDLTIGSAPTADIRIDVPGVAPKHATLRWNGDQIVLREEAGASGTLVNGQTLAVPGTVQPGDEIKISPATLVVNITVAPSSHGRRSLTHGEFVERLAAELARSARSGHPTCLVMVKTRAGDGSAVASAALSSFRGADIVATYAHDEIEFMLPDTPPTIAHAVVDRLLETAGAGGAAVGLAMAPEDGDDAERLIRAARDALAASMRDSTAISRPESEHLEPSEATVRTEATRLALADIQAAAMRDEHVLLVGEANSGKRHYARMLHERGRFSEGPFMLIQCAGLLDPEAVTEAFGDDQGSECTATKARGGTLVLEEIGDLPLQAQRRLLKLVEREGHNMLIVSNTHRDLQALCQVGAFLEPLYAKLAVVRVGIPALRMRAESIVPLAQSFAAQYNHASVKLSPGAIEKMRLYSWPGNVLELRNAMERAVTLADGGEILAEHLPGDPTDPGTGEGRLRKHVGSVERDAIIKALADNNYNQTHAASQLGISRRALIYKMEKYGLKPPPSGNKRD